MYKKYTQIFVKLRKLRSYNVITNKRNRSYYKIKHFVDSTFQPVPPFAKYKIKKYYKSTYFCTV